MTKLLGLAALVAVVGWVVVESYLQGAWINFGVTVFVLGICAGIPMGEWGARVRVRIAARDAASRSLAPVGARLPSGQREPDVSLPASLVAIIKTALTARYEGIDPRDADTQRVTAIRNGFVASGMPLTENWGGDV